MGKKACYLIISVFVLCAIFVHGPIPAKMSEQLGGPPFSDPSEKMEMPSEWRERAIEYDQWAKGADMAVTLDQHLYPALKPLIEQFAADRKMHIRIQEGTCGISSGMLSKKQVDMGGYCCPPAPTDRLPGLEYHTLGISPLAILVNAGNPVKDISLETVRDIFRGNVTNWSQVSAAHERYNVPIRVVGRLHCKQRPGHWRLILDNEDLFATKLYEVSSIRDMIATLSDTRGTIGYEVLWNIGRHEAAGKVKPIMISGADPRREEDMLTKKYPFYRVYNITSWREKSGVDKEAGRELADFLRKKFSTVSAEYGIIPAERLREAGWHFSADELVGEPSGIDGKEN